MTPFPAAAMQAYDVLMLAVLASAVLFGAWKGLAWQLASLSAIVASYIVSIRFRDPVSALIDAAPPWNKFLAMLILYVGTSFVIWLAFRFVSGALDRLRLKEFDRQIGAIFGLAKGVLLCVLITLFGVTLLGDEHRRGIIDSRSGYYIACLLDRADAVMPRELHDVLNPYLHSLDERLDPQHRVRRADAEPPRTHLVPVSELFRTSRQPTSADSPNR